MSSQDSSMLEAKPLLTALVIGESPRWHDARLWFANWGTQEIVAVDLEGNAGTVGLHAHEPCPVTRRRPSGGR